MIETPAAMFRNLCKEIETEFIGAKLDSEEKAREWQRKINNIELWDMRYLENYIAEFSQYYYKIGHNETNLGMFYDKLPYPINSIINEKYIAWLEKADVVDTLGTRISYLRKWVNDQCLDLKKQKKIKKQFLTCWDAPHQWGKEPERRRKRKFYKKKSFNKQRGEKYKRKYYNKPSPKKRRFFRKAAYCPAGKNNCKCWACGETGHYANECKNKKNNKLIETLGSLDYVELNEEEALDLALSNNKGIVEIIIDSEYEESDYEETSHMMESSSISLGDLQGEEFVVDNDHEEVKGDWVLPIIQKDMIYKKSIFQLKSKYVCEMMEGDLEIKDCEYDVGEVNLINWENILKHNKDRKYRYIHVGSVQIQITPLQYYGKDIDLYALLCDIRHTKFNNQIITGIKTNLCNGSVGFNCRPGYYVSLKDEFAKNFLSLKIKTVGMDMKRGGYPLRIFWKIIYKLDNTIDPKTKVTMIEAEKFESPTPMQKIQRIKSNPQDIKIDRSWISSFANPTKINNKNVIKIDEDGKITIKSQLPRSMSTKSEWGE